MAIENYEAFKSFECEITISYLWLTLGAYFVAFQ